MARTVNAIRDLGRVAKGLERSRLIERESAIIRIIDDHPDWHHSRVKRYLVESKLMSGMTFERLIRKMLEDKKISRIQKEIMKNRTYYITALKDPKNEYEFNKGADFMISILENAIMRFSARYKTLSQLEKIESAISLTQICFSNINAFSLYHILEIHKEKVCRPHKNRLEKLVGKVLDLILKDVNDRSIYSLVVAQILPAPEAKSSDQLAK